jgi:hypothetical protein
MSKSAEKRERQRQNYVKATSKLERLTAAYGEGLNDLDDGNAVSAKCIASEIVGKYRGMGRCLQDKEKDGVSYDGPLEADILAAMEATARRFKKAS